MRRYLIYLFCIISLVSCERHIHIDTEECDFFYLIFAFRNEQNDILGKDELELAKDEIKLDVTTYHQDGHVSHFEVPLLSRESAQFGIKSSNWSRSNAMFAYAYHMQRKDPFDSKLVLYVKDVEYEFTLKAYPVGKYNNLVTECTSWDGRKIERQDVIDIIVK